MRPSWDLVLEDIAARRKLGLKKYGQELDADAYVRPLREAYEELLDLVVYLRCALDKQEAKP